MRYKIVRYFANGSRKRIIQHNVSLAEAQAHCKDPETSSRTAISANAKALTKRRGQWFDGYTNE